MSLTDPYISPEDYRRRVGSAVSEDVNSLKADLVSISRLVERTLGQYFNVETAASDHVYEAKWSDHLDIDYMGLCPGLATTDGLVIKVDTDNDGLFSDETAWLTTDYELLPRDAVLRPEPEPYTTIRTRRGGAQVFRPGGLVQVTGKMGWPAVPEMVIELVVLWTKIWRLEGPEGTGQITQLGSVVNISLDVKRLQDRAMDAYGARVTL